MNKGTETDHRSFLVSGARSMVIQSVGILASTTLTIMLARSLGIEQFGIYGFLMALVTMLAIPVQFGLPTLIVRETAQLLEQRRDKQIRRLWSWATGIIFGMSFLIGAGLLLVSMLLTFEIATPALLGFAGLLVPVYALGNIRAAALRGLGLVQLGQLPDVVLRPVFLLVMVSVVILLGQAIDARFALLLQLSAAVGAFFVGAVLLMRHAPRGGIGAVEPLRHKILLGSILFLGLASNLRVANQQISTFLLGILGTPADVGQFRVALSLSLLVATMLSVLNTVLQPRIALLHARGDSTGLKSLVTFSARLSFGASVLITFVLVVYGKWVVDLLFGVEFAGTYPVLALLIVGQLANSAFGPVALLLNMCGHERQTFSGILASLIVTFILTVLMTPTYGAVGAAISTVVGVCTWNAILYFKVYVLIGVDCSPLGLHPKGFK